MRQMGHITDTKNAFSATNSVPFCTLPRYDFRPCRGTPMRPKRDTKSHPLDRLSCSCRAKRTMASSRERECELTRPRPSCNKARWSSAPPWASIPLDTWKTGHTGPKPPHSAPLHCRVPSSDTSPKLDQNPYSTNSTHHRYEKNASSYDQCRVERKREFRPQV